MQIGENSYAIDRATLQSWLVQGEDGPTRFAGSKRQLLCAIWRRDGHLGLAHTLQNESWRDLNLNAGGDYGWCIDKEETTQALLQAIEDETQGNLDPVYL